jgi:hypothetical protein
MGEQNSTNEPRSELSDLARRVQALENQAREDKRSVIPRVQRLGIVVGCLGGLLGGVYTIQQIHKQYSAAPRIQPGGGGPIKLSWDSAGRQIGFSFGLGLKNNGEAPGSITVARAYLKSPAPSAEKPIDVGVRSIRVSERSVPLDFPVSLKAGDVRDVELTITSELPPERQPALQRDGLYELVLVLDRDGSAEKTEVSYCFWLGTGATNPLTKTGTTAYDPDPGCQTLQ